MMPPPYNDLYQIFQVPGYVVLFPEMANNPPRIIPTDGRGHVSERIRQWPGHSVGRWDGDGAPDTLLRSGDGLAVYPGNGPGGLTGRTALGFDAARYDWVLGVSDLRLTGHGDLVVREKVSGRLWALTVTAKKGITSRRLLGQGMEVYDRAG